jgi:hypothetical protein
VGLKLNGTHNLLVFTADLNLFGENICTIKKNTGAIIDVIKGVRLKVNTQNSKCMLISIHQNAGQKRNIKTRIWEREYQIKVLLLGKSRAE